MIVVSNASPLIALSKIKKFHLLKELFSEVKIPEAVYREVVVHGKGQTGAKEVRTASERFIHVISVRDTLAVEVLLSELHYGEAESIILAKEIEADLLLLDDDRAKVKAKSLGLSAHGTLGLLLMAHERGLIKNIKQSLYELREKGFWVRDEIIEVVVRVCEEKK